jgi:2,3,4,5-tetrahydropyridine-2-carboxylate N-succinyltransferase
MGMASGIGLANITAQGTVLDVWFPQPRLSELASSDASNVQAELAQLQGVDSDRDVQRKIIEIEIDTTKAPASTADVYLRLHLLSHRLVKPHGQSLEGILAYYQTLCGPPLALALTIILKKLALA